MSARLWPCGTQRGRKRSNIQSFIESRVSYNQGATGTSTIGWEKTGWYHPYSVESRQKSCWDATVIDTLASSYLTASAAQSGAAAAIAEDRMMQKYHAFLQDHVFIPLALETMGPINTAGLNFISDLGRRLTLATGEERETTYLFQRLSITMQRFNAVSFRGSFNKPTPDKDNNDIIYNNNNNNN